jgi:hypothetical protein
MPKNINRYLQAGATELSELAITFSQLIAGLAVDPHGYFEKKYAARIEQSQSEQEVRGVLVQLLQWAVSSAVTDSERETLDRELAERGMPNINDLRANLLP